jgi:hypothetical protein
MRTKPQRGEAYGSQLSSRRPLVSHENENSREAVKALHRPMNPKFFGTANNGRVIFGPFIHRKTEFN